MHSIANLSAEIASISKENSSLSEMRERSSATALSLSEQNSALVSQNSVLSSQISVLASGLDRLNVEVTDAWRRIQDTAHKLSDPVSPMTFVLVAEQLRAIQFAVGTLRAGIQPAQPVPLPSLPVPAPSN